MPPYLRGLIGASLFFGLVACDDGTGAVLNLDSTGAVSGTVFLDVNGDGEMTPPADQPLAGLQVTLLQRGTSRVEAQALTSETGTYSLPDVPIGRYNVTIVSASLGDSLQITSVNPEEVQVGANLTASVDIGLDRRLMTIAAVRSMIGRQVSVEGVALSSWNNFGDASLHIEDDTGFLRAVRVPSSAIAVGDRVRLSGTMVLQDGRPTLDQPVVMPLDETGQPRIRIINSAGAATADGGALDGALARVSAARVIEVRAGPAGSSIVVIDDGSGPLEVSLESAAGIVTELPLLTGASIEVAGVLVPNGSAWRLRPRSSADLVVTLLSPTIAEFRALPAGTAVSLEGTAITSTANFNDGTIHLTDGTGSVRATGISGISIAAGVRVRLVGSVGASNSQPVLVNSSVEPVILGTAAIPTPVGVNTGTAADARDGSLDAALVRVGPTRVIEVRSGPAGSTLVVIDDGSGRLEVSLESAAGIVTELPLVAGATTEVTGVLVPSGSAWRLRPRSSADVVVTLPTPTIAQFRMLPAGTRVSLEGTAITSTANFNDGTIHLTDGTGSVRVTGISGISISAGDRVRLVGAVGASNAQPILVNSSAPRILGTAAVPGPVSVTSGTAADAADGALDAALVRVGAARIIEVRSGPAGSTLVGIDDGSGRLDVSLESAAGIITELPLVAGATIDVTGVLVPGGSVWRLRPRSSADVLVTLPTPTIAQFRTLPAGTTVSLEGTAITSSANFNDGTIHLTDGTGWVRVTGIAGISISAGNRVRLVGSVGASNSQPVLVNSSVAPRIIGTASIPAPIGVNAGTADDARDGALDAALVRVGLVLVRDATTVGGERRVTVQDLTGSLQIVLDPDSGIPNNLLVPNALIAGITGVLVPTTGGRWFLKPRSASDISR